MKIIVLSLILMGLVSTASLAKVELALKVLKQTVTLGNELYKTFKNDDVTPEDVILNVVKTIPIIGDIVKIFTGDSDDDILNNLEAQLKSLTRLQERTMQYLQDLNQNLNLVVMKNQISEASKVINSCSQDFNHLLQNPTSQADQERLISCYGTIMIEVRQLGRILKEEYTLESPKIFQHIIQTDGYCDGTKIVHTFKYLFGLLILGCESAIVSEALKYENKSKTLLNECVQLIQDIVSHIFDIFNICKKDACDDVVEAIKKAVNLHINSDVSKLAEELIARLPWFSFTVFKLTGNPMMRITGNFLPSYVTVDSSKIYLIILWTPFETLKNYDDSYLSFYLEFDNYKYEYRGMNITRTLSGSRATVVGYFRSNVKDEKYEQCSSEINVDSSNPGSGSVSGSVSSSSSSSNTHICLSLLAMIFIVAT